MVTFCYGFLKSCKIYYKSEMPSIYMQFIKVMYFRFNQSSILTRRRRTFSSHDNYKVAVILFMFMSLLYTFFPYTILSYLSIILSYVISFRLSLSYLILSVFGFLIIFCLIFPASWLDVFHVNLSVNRSLYYLLCILLMY